MMAIIHKSEVVDISAEDHDFTLKTTAIYCGASGTLVAKLRGDSAARSWPVAAQQYLLGDFESVTKAGTSAALAAANMLFGVTDRT